MIRVAALTLAMVAAACGREPATAGVVAGMPDGKTEGGAVPALQVTISTSTTELRRAGDVLDITVTATNTGRERRTVEANSGCFTDYEVLDEEGKLVARSGQMCTAVMSRRELGAGEALSERFVWTLGMRGSPPVRPGRYQLRGLLLQRGDTLRSQPVSLVVGDGSG